MTDLWKKLNFKDHPRVVVINAPQSFEDEIDRLESTQVLRSCGKAKRIEFMLAFVTKRSEVKRITQQVAKKSEGDPVVWFAYPKQTSKNYACEFNRDWGWVSVDLSIVKDWKLVRELVTQSYCLIAPKRSIKKLDQ